MPPVRPTLRLAALLLLAAGAVGANHPSPARLAAAADTLSGDGARSVRLAETAFGLSGSLRAVVVEAGAAITLPLEWSGVAPEEVAYRWEPVAGGRSAVLEGEHRLAQGLVAPSTPGTWRLRVRAGGWSQPVESLTVITRVPFASKRGGYLNGYRIGAWATEGTGRTDAYAPPAGFIEVTPENQDLLVSERFRLRDFLTKDQFSVWPKYLALDLRLIDKLELVMQELAAMGVRAERMTVMSGFRTPAYNAPGVGSGRALLSRHTYGDAADVWIDDDGDGYMDDLNGDGRRDHEDALVLLRAVERVERRFPELMGGAGVYRSSGARGPFVHIDARGYVSRW